VPTNLAAVPHCAILVRTTSNKVRLLHHFKKSGENPLEPELQKELWGLYGCEAGAMAALVPSEDATWTKAAAFAPPSLESLRKCTTAAEIAKVPPAKTYLASSSSHPAEATVANAVAIPPPLVATIMRADTEDPCVLCLRVLKTLRDMDTVMLDSEGDADTAPGAIEKALGFVPQFLWAVAFEAASKTSELKPITIDVVSSGPAARWARELPVHESFLTSASGTPNGKPSRRTHEIGGRNRAGPLQTAPFVGRSQRRTPPVARDDADEEERVRFFPRAPTPPCPPLQRTDARRSSRLEWKHH
jgi:hypothetical protein